MKWLRMFGTIMAVTISIGAHAQEECNALLQHGIFDQIRQQTAQSSAAVIQSNICDQYSKMQQDVKAGSLAASYGLFGGSVSLSSQQLESIASLMCKSDYSNTAASNAASYSRSFIDTGAVTSWRQCISLLADGLRVKTTFREEDQGAITIEVRYVSPVPGAPNIQKIDISPATAFSCNGTLWDARNNTKMSEGWYAMTCSRSISNTPKVVGGRQVLAEAASITVMTTAGTILRNLAPVYPRPMPPTPTEVLMSNFPRGTILAWFDKGVSVPKGWAMCDGKNGTPDLRGKFLRGSAELQDIGTDGGAETHDHNFRVSIPGGPLKGSDFHFGETPWANGPNPVRGGDSGGGTTAAATHLPPYKSVLFIMKL